MREPLSDQSVSCCLTVKMGHLISCFKAQNTEGRSGVKKLTTPTRSVTNPDHPSPLVGATDEDATGSRGGKKKKKKKRFKWWKKTRGQCEKRDQPSMPHVTIEGNNEPHVIDSSSISTSEVLETTLAEPPVCSVSGPPVDVQNPDHTKSDLCKDVSQILARGESDRVKEISQSQANVIQEVLKFYERSLIKDLKEINSCQYQIGGVLGRGTTGIIYEGTRLKDGLKVAVKYVTKTTHIKYISIPGYPEPIPQEIAWHILANKTPCVSEIIQLLDWENLPKGYIMVLEHVPHCKTLLEFLKDAGGKLNEDVAQIIMFNVSTAAFQCCYRGVFHRDITLENILINTHTFELKLIDFGSSAFLKNSAYWSYMGTRDYVCPEYCKRGKYYGKPATVWSLGLVFYLMVCGTFPSEGDWTMIERKIFCKYWLSEDCCSLIQDCLQENPEKRIQLHNIFFHTFFRIREL